MKKKLLLLFLFVFTSMILSGEIKKENIIGKKNRFFVSIAGETQDSALYVEFKDENKYTFFSPYGGYLWEICDYKIKGDTISLSVMIDEKPLLSKMFMQMKNMFETCRSQTAEVPEFFHAATGTNPFL